MAEIVLVNSQGKNVRSRHEHLGLGYLKCYLGTLGIDADIVDGQFHALPPEEIARRVLAQNPRLVGLSVFFNNVGSSLAVVRLLRSAGYSGHICLGGHYATFQYDLLLEREPGIDCVVMGEGEYTLAELVDRLRMGQAWQDLPGLALRDPLGRPCATSPRPLVPDLDALPFPDRSPYMKDVQAERTARMASSRGCYARCGFCSVNAFYRLGLGPRWRPRSARNVVDEMEYLARQGVKYVHFVDDNFMGPGEIGRRRAVEIGQEILRRDLQMGFDLDCRATDVNKEVLSFLRQAGLRRVGIGVESMIPRQLKLYRKGVTVEQNLAAIEILEQLGGEYWLFFLPVEPYVTVEELLDDMAMMEQIGLEHILDDQILAWLVVLNGTSIVDDIRRDGLLYNMPEGTLDLEYPWGLPYVFRDRRVGTALPHLHALYFAYMGLRDTLIDQVTTSDVLVLRFLNQVTEALKRQKFEAIRELLRAAQQGETEAASRVLLSRVKDIEANVAQMVAAYRTGSFNIFQPMQLSLGDTVLTYPPPEFTSLVETMYDQLAQAKEE